MSFIAKRMLCMIATSVPVKSVFGSAGFIANKFRSRLDKFARLLKGFEKRVSFSFLWPVLYYLKINMWVSFIVIFRCICT